ncbi:MAG: LamG domain-containing protein [Desulfobacterales bacterium]|nr:LamG domain-containing protein [Desulfobacterales bacterium]
MNKKNYLLSLIVFMACMFITVIPESQADTILRMNFNGDVNDDSSNSLNGEWVGTESYSMGLDSNGQSLNLSPTNNNYVIVRHDEMLSGMQQLHISIWAKKNNSEIGGYIINKHNHYVIKIGSNFVNGFITNSQGQCMHIKKYSLASIRNTSWHHYELTYDGEMVRLWVDEQEVAQHNFTGSINTDKSRDLYIGKNPWGSSFDGQIDALEIKNHLGINDNNNSCSSISKNGITWNFDQEYPCGTFANGDYWVVGPVKVIGIRNNYHIYGITPRYGQDGSMINPGTDTRQGYDDSLNSYTESLNVSHPNGMDISDGNPLSLNAGETLVSSVSWLYVSEDNKEPGCPTINGSTGTPRPVLRAAAVLTCLEAVPPEGSFRPPYVGNVKNVNFNISQLQLGLLQNLSTAGLTGIPDPIAMENDFKEVWLDHVHEYLGSYLHPSDNMKVHSGYGQYMAMKIGDASLLLNLNYSELPGSPTKTNLMINMVQLGIDLAGIADNGGYWAPNGGHNVGRKWPILFAGMMLNDDHMKNVGSWTTLFQEDGGTFFVTQEEINRTNESFNHPDYCWIPDSRDIAAGRIQAYTTSDIGLPDWGIRHITQPCRNNGHFDSAYRDINGVANTGFTLAAILMNAKNLWAHDALFDYQDRWWNMKGGDHGSQHVSPFTKSMWTRYR